jgi:hypothetical protein
MTLREFLLYLKVCGEATISVEDAKKLITCGDEGVDVKVVHIDPPISPEIRSYYEGGEKCRK